MPPDTGVKRAVADTPLVVSFRVYRTLPARAGPTLPRNKAKAIRPNGVRLMPASLHQRSKVIAIPR
jgi:hypothetical protein